MMAQFVVPVLPKKGHFCTMPDFVLLLLAYAVKSWIISFPLPVILE